jgi:hypothetical protein
MPTLSLPKRKSRAPWRNWLSEGIVFQPSHNSAWQCLYSPRFKQTFLVLGPIEESNLKAAEGDRRQEVSNAYKKGGFRAVERIFQTNN